jgi:hypothetical protein
MKLSLRDLLYAVTIAAILCGWWAEHRHQAKQIEKLEHQNLLLQAKAMEHQRASQKWAELARQREQFDDRSFRSGPAAGGFSPKKPQDF